jgi:dCMP deaminase
MLSQIANIVQENETRLEWDDYFMSIALLGSCRSPCSRLHVGSVITKSNRIVSIGYNGFIVGTPHISYIREGHEQAIIHSEINALANSNRLGGTSLEGAMIYITHYPCINCFKSIVATGINEIIYMYDYNNDSLVQTIASESYIKIRKILS